MPGPSPLPGKVLPAPPPLPPLPSSVGGDAGLVTVNELDAAWLPGVRVVYCTRINV
jgi:hypothetical protein